LKPEAVYVLNPKKKCIFVKKKEEYGSENRKIVASHLAR
jgi:hypothetical protein